MNGAAPRIFRVQASGCVPIARPIRDGAEFTPEIPHTIARSIAIGNPADGRYAAKSIRGSGGWAAHVSHEELVRGFRMLAEDTGIFTRTPGGVTVAAALAAEQR